MIKCKGNVGTSLILILMRCLCFLHQQAPCENKTITNKKIKNEVKQTNVSACVVCTAVALQQALLPETFARVTQVSFSFSFNSLHVFFLFPLTKFIQLPNPPMVRCNTGLWASKAWLPLSISKRTHTHKKKKKTEQHRLDQNYDDIDTGAADVRHQHSYWHGSWEAGGPENACLLHWSRLGTEKRRAYPVVTDPAG